MTAVEFASRVEGPRRRGAAFVSRCPAHDDTNPSLSFRDGDQGLVLKCHAGCETGAILKPLGLRYADLFHVPASTTPTRIIATTYPYRDESGELLFEVVRFEPKGFTQRRPDGHGGWIPNLTGVRRVLYRLPDLNGQDGVYVVEGEKDVDTLWVQGLPATTNPGGAGSWRADYASQLQAAGVGIVIIIPDNDRTGVAHATDIEHSCRDAGLAAFTITLPGLPPVRDKHGEDVSDWLHGGHDAAELEALAEAAVTGQEATTAAPASGPVLVRLADVAPEPVAWLWPGRLARGKVTILAGDPGLGKSFLTLDAASRISTGQAWPDAGRALLGDAILLSAEDGIADTIRPRVDALQGDASRFHILRAVRTQDGEHAFSLAADLPALLEMAITATEAVLVVIDPLSAYLGGTDSYKDAEVRALLAPLAAMAERHAVSVLAVMHLTKDSQRRAIHRAGGSVGFVGAARVVLAVGKDPDDDARRLLVPVKTNVSSPPATLAYRLVESTPGAARVEWEPDPVAGIEADTLLGVAAAEDREERRDADLLQELLAGGGQQLSTELFKAARANGVSERTLYRAKRRLGIKARHVGQPGKKGAWCWVLPDVEWEPPKAATRTEGCHIHRRGSLQQPSDEKDEMATVFPEAATSQGMAAFGGNLRGNGSLGTEIEEVIHGQPHDAYAGPG